MEDYKLKQIKKIYNLYLGNFINPNHALIDIGNILEQQIIVGTEVKCLDHINSNIIFEADKIEFIL